LAKDFATFARRALKVTLSVSVSFEKVDRNAKNQNSSKSIDFHAQRDTQNLQSLYKLLPAFKSESGANTDIIIRQMGLACSQFASLRDTTSIETFFSKAGAPSRKSGDNWNARGANESNVAIEDEMRLALRNPAFTFKKRDVAAAAALGDQSADHVALEDANDTLSAMKSTSAACAIDTVTSVNNVQTNNSTAAIELIDDTINNGDVDIDLAYAAKLQVNHSYSSILLISAPTDKFF
jgi:hypothetical protein